MHTSTETLDQIFIPLFESLDNGEIVNIVDLNWNFDFRQKSGPLTKGELEYVINYQIRLNKIEVISETEFKKVDTATSQKPYLAKQEIIVKAAKEYSKQFWGKYNDLNNT